MRCADIGSASFSAGTPATAASVRIQKITQEILAQLLVFSVSSRREVFGKCGGQISQTSVQRGLSKPKRTSNHTLLVNEGVTVPDNSMPTANAKAQSSLTEVTASRMITISPSRPYRS